MIRSRIFVFVLLIFVLAIGSSVYAQTTEFVYQGQLQNSAAPANGSFDFEFVLFDALSGGTQVGSTQTRSGVTVTNGIFSVKLDFGAVYPGAARFLEIHVKPGGAGGGFQQLLPRQAISNTLYAVKSLNADNATSATNATSAAMATNSTQLGGVAANQYTLTTDPRLSDSRPPTSGSANYVQNTTAQQASSNFNITGNGTVGGTLSGNQVNAATQYNIGGVRVFSNAGTNNLFAGVGAGNSNTGTGNSFFGNSAGHANTSGFSNSFVGDSAGAANTTGRSNSFFGESAGVLNTTGIFNSFFGDSAGFSNTTGSSNTFFGTLAGSMNAGSNSSSFFGANAGQANTGGENSFFGSTAGQATTTGSENSFFGVRAGTSNTTGRFNSFFGVEAGLENTTGNANSFFGFDAGAFSTGGGNSFFGENTGLTDRTGSDLTLIGISADVGSSNLSFATAIGASAVVSNSNSIVLGRAADTVRIPGNLIIAGSISKGSGSFRIDHPLDPANKYLYHSFVESPDMMNVYNGNIVTNEKGEAIVKLPDYFEALNRDFRYQLTVIGQFAQAIVATEMKGNQFEIKTDKPNVKVSWQVTGIRHDKFADDERIRVEENKPADERGKCLYAPACQNVRP